MEPDAKEAEVRARVTRQTYDALTEIATARGEQVPVIVREALAEYLAVRVAPSAPSQYPGHEAAVAALRDNPEVIEILARLALALRDKPVVYRVRSKAKTSSDRLHEATDQKLAEIVRRHHSKAGSPPKESK